MLFRSLVLLRDECPSINLLQLDIFLLAVFRVLPADYEVVKTQDVISAQLSTSRILDDSSTRFEDDRNFRYLSHNAKVLENWVVCISLKSQSHVVWRQGIIPSQSCLRPLQSLPDKYFSPLSELKSFAFSYSTDAVKCSSTRSPRPLEDSPTSRTSIVDKVKPKA